MKQRAIAEYLRKNALCHVAGVALRCVSASARLSRHSYYDMEEAEQYFAGNLLADSPSVLTGAAYRMVAGLCAKGRASAAMSAISLACDLACGYLLDSAGYFLASSALPSDLASAACLLFALQHKKQAARVVGPVLLLACLESTHSKCEPGVNVYWYINMQMFAEYKTLFREVFQLTHYFFLAVSTLSRHTSTKAYMAMVFKDFGYRGYLLVWSLMGEKRRPGRLFGLCRGGAMAGAAIDHVVWYMLVYGGVGNMNFLCWSNTVTVMLTGAAVLAHECREQGRRRAAATQAKSLRPG